MFFELCIALVITGLFVCVLHAFELVITPDHAYVIIRWFEWLGRREYDKTLTFEEYLSWSEIEE